MTRAATSRNWTSTTTASKPPARRGRTRTRRTSESGAHETAIKEAECPSSPFTDHLTAWRLSGSPSVLIVAGPNDGAAIHLRESLEAKGQRVAQLDGPAASRLFTVRVGPDKTSVEPDLPMFVRASAWWYDEAAADSDERFLRSEAYAAFWAAAALSSAPVINRPNGNGAVGRLTAAELASRLTSEPPLAVRELHASGPELITDATDSMWGEDSNFLTARVSANCALRRRPTAGSRVESMRSE